MPPDLRSTLGFDVIGMASQVRHLKHYEDTSPSRGGCIGNGPVDSRMPLRVAAKDDGVIFAKGFRAEGSRDRYTCPLRGVEKTVGRNRRTDFR